MREKTRKIIAYILDRLGEASTWQGIGFMVVASGSKFGMGLDWGAAAALGGALSAVIKMVMADK